LSRNTPVETKSPKDNDSKVENEISEPHKSKRNAYENTGPLKCEVPSLHPNTDEFGSENDGKQSSNLKSNSSIDSFQMSSNDDELASCFNETPSQSNSSYYRCNKTLTMTEQLVNQMSQRRPSPIGMEEEMINDEDQYTNMDENNTCTNNHTKQRHGEYYEPMECNNFDQTFQNPQGKRFYVPMNESLRQPDSGLYENERSDQESEGRDSCYEEIDFPVKTKSVKKEAQSNPSKVLNEDDNSASDSEDLHYHQVDLSSLALSLDEDIYEDIDVKEKTMHVTDRPTPPLRRAKSLKSEGENSDCGAFHTPPTPPQGLLIETTSPTSLPKYVTKPGTPSSSPKQTKTTITSPTTPPKTLENSSSSKSSDFEYIDDVQLHIAIRESMESIKKQNKSRPPAPPPKKLNYVKVEPLPGAKLGAIPKQTQQTNYTDVVGTEKPPIQTFSKEDEMEYIDDCELHFSEMEELKRQKKRKDQLKKQVEKGLSGKTTNTTKYGSPASCESAYINKIREEESHDNNKPTDKETGDLSNTKPKRLDTNKLVQVLPRDFNKPTLEKNSSRVANKSIKPAVPKKPKPRPETLKKPSVNPTDVQSNSNSLLSSDSFKKRAMIPPPKPKRLFLDNNNERENKTDGEQVKLQPRIDCTNTQDNTSTTATHHQTKAPRKKPLPLPRKKLGGNNPKTT